MSKPSLLLLFGVALAASACNVSPSEIEDSFALLDAKTPAPMALPDNSDPVNVDPSRSLPYDYNGVGGELPPSVCGTPGRRYSFVSLTPSPVNVLSANATVTFTASVNYSITGGARTISLRVMAPNGSLLYSAPASQTTTVSGCGTVSLSLYGVTTAGREGVVVQVYDGSYDWETWTPYAIEGQTFLRISALSQPLNQALQIQEDGRVHFGVGVEWDLVGQGYWGYFQWYSDDHSDELYNDELPEGPGGVAYKKSFKPYCYEDYVTAEFSLYPDASGLDRYAQATWYIEPSLVADANNDHFWIGTDDYIEDYVWFENCTDEGKAVTLSSNVDWLHFNDESNWVSANSDNYNYFWVEEGLTPGTHVATITLTADGNIRRKIDITIDVRGKNDYSVANTSFDWFDQATGSNSTEIWDAGSDDDVMSIDLPFPVAFYGIEYNVIQVSSNGFLTFGDYYADDYGYNLPVDELPNSLHVNQDDMYVTDTGSVRYATIGNAPDRKFIITWTDVGYCCGNSYKSTYQAVLSEGSDAFLLQYLTLSAYGEAGVNWGDGYTGFSFDHYEGEAYIVKPVRQTGNSGPVR